VAAIVTVVTECVLLKALGVDDDAWLATRLLSTRFPREKNADDDNDEEEEDANDDMPPAARWCWFFFFLRGEKSGETKREEVK